MATGVNAVIFKTILPNGLTVLVYPQGRVPKVSVQLWYGVGSKDEKSGEKGIAHLIEHMIFKGTHLLAESDINLVTHKLSGYANAFTSFDYTGYLFDFPTQNWQESLPIMADCMHNATFKEELLHAELKAVIQELKMYKDDYLSTLAEEMASVIFKGHPYHNPIIGYKHDLWSINRETMLNFYRKHYISNNATLIVVGDIEPAETFDLAQQHFGSLVANPTYKKEEFPFFPDIIARSVTLYRDVAQPFVMFAWTVPGAKQRVDFVFDTLTFLLGGGKGARLYKKIVDELQLATDLDVFVYDFFDESLLYIYLQPKSLDYIDQIKAVIAEELALIIADGFTASELQRAYKKASMEYLSIFENNQRTADAIGRCFSATGDERYIFTYLDNNPELVQESLHSLISKYLRPAVMHQGMVLPISEQEQINWQELQEASDEQDAQVLGTRIRESMVEEGTYAQTITAKPPIPCVFPAYQITMLRNNLELIQCLQEDLPKIDICLELKAKDYYDASEKAGLYDFVTEMMMEGTQNYTAQQLVERLELSGITIEIEPGFVGLSLPATELKSALELLVELLTKATFPEDSLDKVREILLAEVKMYWDSPNEFAQELVKRELYAGHPYSKSEVGTEETINSITRHDIDQAYRTYFTPHGARLTVVGDLRGYDIPALFNEILGGWQGPMPAIIPFPALKPITQKEINYPINRDQIVLCLAGHSVKRMDSDFDKLLIFDQIFTGGILGSMSARLFQLREQSGLFYTITGSLFAFADEQPGAVFIKTIVSIDKIKEAEWLIRGAIDTAIESVLPDEFEQAKAAVINSLPDNFESNRRISEALLFLRRYDLTADFFNNRAYDLAHITLDDVKVAVEKVLNNNRLLALRIGRSDGLYLRSNLS